MPQSSPPTISYTTINHKARKNLKLTMNDYAVADLIHRMCGNNPRSQHPGWCYASKKYIGDTLGMAQRSVFRAIEGLTEKQLIEHGQQEGHVRTTTLWFDTVEFPKETDKPDQPPIPMTTCHTPYDNMADPTYAKMADKNKIVENKNENTTNVGDAAASPTGALSKKKARKEPNPDGSYGDPDVTAVCAYFKEKLGRTRIDKSDRWNRIMASNLLRGEPDGLAGVKRLIDRLAQDDFWPPNITSLHDLYDKREKITQRGLAREASQQAINTAVTVDEQGIIRGQGFIDISNITSSGN